MFLARKVGFAKNADTPSRAGGETNTGHQRVKCPATMKQTVPRVDLEQVSITLAASTLRPFAPTLPPSSNHRVNPTH